MKTAHVPYASYATYADQSRGRLHKEPESPNRTVFQRDRDRVLHAGAFRRLIHKTQVFVAHVGDYYRTRLTHSLEVAQIARSIALELGLNEELAETLALCHDLGHTPFGHAGEEALNACMGEHGGFDHNAQSLRIVTHLEQRYAEFDGLNLTWETLEGLVKHNGPLLKDGITLADLPYAIRKYHEKMDLELDTHAGPEAQVAALADDIAYNNHDIDDGLRAGLFTVEDLMTLPMVGDILRKVQQAYPDATPRQCRHETIRRLISTMVADVVAETGRRLQKCQPKTVEDIRRFNMPLVAFSEEMEAYHQALKKFLYTRMYRHYKVNRAMRKARRVVRQLFETFYDEPNTLPHQWQSLCDEKGSDITARVICDYIAGMTDRFALEEHGRVFDISGSRL